MGIGKKVRDASLVVLAAAIAIRLAWLVVAPLVPYAIVIVVVALIISMMFRRV